MAGTCHRVQRVQQRVEDFEFYGRGVGRTSAVSRVTDCQLGPGELTRSAAEGGGAWHARLRRPLCDNGHETETALAEIASPRR